MSDDVFNTEVDIKHKEIIEILESIDIDSLKSNGLKIQIGGNTFEFNGLKVVDNANVEEKIREEYKIKLNDQQQRIREKINQKINQLLVMHQQKQKELDRKEENLKRKYSEAAMMPDINETLLAKGLSVAKGDYDNELVWVYRATYSPKFIIYYPGGRYGNENKKHKPLPKRLITQMKRPMLILVKTKDNAVTSVATRTIDNNNNRLAPFPHYHQQTTQDCWGSWRYPKKWKNPTDILNIAKAAESVLETINQGSLAEQNPNGLPRISTIISGAEKMSDVDADKILKSLSRDSINSDREADEDIWNAV